MSALGSVERPWLPLAVGLVLAAPGSSEAQLDLSIDRLQVTQSTQDPDGTIPAVDRRATTVRLVLRSGVESPVSGVQGKLQVFQGGALLHDLLSDNGPIAVPVNFSSLEENHTLNFTFIPDGGGLFDRTLTLVATVDPFDDVQEEDETNNTLSVEKRFECRRAPSILGVPIDYQAAGEPDRSTIGEPDPNLIARGVGDAFLMAAYPFPEYEPGQSSPYEVLAGPSPIWLLDIDASKSSLLDALEIFRASLSPLPDHVYGWFRGNPYSGNGSARTPGNVSFGHTDPDMFQHTLAHEIGHNLGFDHEEFGEISYEIGWDALDRLGLGHVKSGFLYDIMVPEQPTADSWVHPDTYEAVRDIATTPCLTRVAAPLDYLVVVGRVPLEPASPWQVRSMVRLTSVRAPIEGQKGGIGTIRVLDGAGQELYSSTFNPAPASHGEGPQELGFAEHVPWIEEARRIEILARGALQERIDRSPSPPQVHILSPSAGEEAADLIPVAWRTEDPDGDALRTIVRYSHDGGRTFIPLGLFPAQDRLDVPAERLPSSDAGMVQVLVSDGFNSATAQVENLRVGRNHPPRVRIVKRGPGVVIKQGANLALVAHAGDDEDGAIPPEDIQWFSDADGPLGTGRVLNCATLSPGTHRVGLLATDSRGASAEDSVAVRVVSREPSPRRFRRGDANRDGKVDISDGLAVLGFLFLGSQELGCGDSGDTDDGGGVDISDAVRIFGFLFLGGPPPASPGPFRCGIDPTDEDGLGCASYGRCTEDGP